MEVVVAKSMREGVFVETIIDSKFGGVWGVVLR